MTRYAALKSLYEVEKTIGTGGFAKVKLATHLLTKEKVAIKIMDKACLGDDYPRVKIELEALKSISHHHICKLYQVIETPTHFFLVMEYCSGGELFDHIVERNRLSESESRCFFRQILSAVAYLHSRGYAHRDLKPENILLDRDQNLKLIDFGLCAKPDGGIKSQLQTSCGSPTYAAPELIKGHKYTGPQVDVWSMGVLLYALLCGFLPFDCDTIDGLYKKILDGSYEEPPWLSRGSREIIRRMLQTNPAVRITVDQLLAHPWITTGTLKPVRIESQDKFQERDDSVLQEIAKAHGVTPNKVWDKIKRWDYDYDTATYQLLLALKKRGENLRLYYGPYALRRRISNVPSSFMGPQKEVLSPTRYSYKKMQEAHDKDNGDITNAEKENGELKTTPSRNQRKRAHDEEHQSPVPVKITPGRGRQEMKTPCTPPRTPTSSQTPKKRFLTSVEKKFNQVRKVLTPRKRLDNPPAPPLLLQSRELCNVSTTNSTSPELVLDELRSSLSQKGIFCKAKGYRLRGKASSEKGTECSFELEVCLVQSGSEEPIVGIRRKRLKGDAWCYKQICEQILRMAQTDFKA